MGCLAAAMEMLRQLHRENCSLYAFRHIPRIHPVTRSGRHILELPDRLVRLNEHVIRQLNDTLMWLMTWPAGLKLNSFLSKFLGELFLWMLDAWSAVSERKDAVLCTGSGQQVCILCLCWQRCSLYCQVHIADNQCIHMPPDILLSHRLSSVQMATNDLDILVPFISWQTLECAQMPPGLDNLCLGSAVAGYRAVLHHGFLLPHRYRLLCAVSHLQT